MDIVGGHEKGGVHGFVVGGRGGGDGVYAGTSGAVEVGMESEEPKRRFVELGGELRFEGCDLRGSQEVGLREEDDHVSEGGECAKVVDVGGLEG